MATQTAQRLLQIKVVNNRIGPCLSRIAGPHCLKCHHYHRSRQISLIATFEQLRGNLLAFAIESNRRYPRSQLPELRQPL
ncbi:hypothetical protein U879_05425 [Defluviimonas sp. 20V17]|nr:hypothetical protein U879_05425 [Defluviimonas sp. 20V17]